VVARKGLQAPPTPGCCPVSLKLIGRKRGLVSVELATAVLEGSVGWFCDHSAMTYDTAVWESERPASDEQAGEIFSALYDRYLESEGLDVSPTDRIRHYVETLLERWPDDEDGPWATAPLVDEASGPVIYFPMSYSRADEVSAYCAQIAAEHGLICFDVQWNRIRS
jgi:hypothetical protein